MPHSYAMSDLHGEYGKFLRMLETIRFQSEDTLYVLGDVVDRGPEPVRLLQDLALRPNVTCLLGNHEFMALRTLRALEAESAAAPAAPRPGGGVLHGYAEWMYNGGAPTLEQYLALSPAEQAEVKEFLSELSLYERVRAGGREFVLVHAGFANYRPDRPLKDYTAEELIFTRGAAAETALPHTCTVAGHTPTPLLLGRPEIYHRGRYINIDCGACFSTGRLACLCLDTMEEFYV